MLAKVSSFVCIATRKIQASNASFIAENGPAFATNSVRAAGTPGKTTSHLFIFAAKVVPSNVRLQI